MATDIERLVVQLEANMRNYDRSMQRAGLQARQASDRIEREFAKANNNISRQFTAMGRAGQVAFAAVATAATGLIARELVNVADSVNQLRGRIALYADSAEETEQIIGALFDRSRDLGASFDGLAETYARIVPSQDALNLSTEQMLNLSEAVASAFIVSGASAEEARNATLQLSQAFASGELRGEELRSVMEQGQRIMMALTSATGETTGGLREMAEQGRLTADVVANALLDELPKLREEMESLPVTVSRGMQSLRSSVTELISNVDRATGASEGLGEAIQGMANAVDNFNTRLNETPEAKLARLEEAAENIADDLPAAVQALQFFRDGMMGGAETLLDTGVELGTDFADSVMTGSIALTELLTGDYGENRRAERIAALRQEVENLERTYMRAGMGEMFDNRLGGAQTDPAPASGDGGSGGSGSSSPRFGSVNGGEEIIRVDAKGASASGIEDLTAQKYKSQMDAAREMGVVQAEEYARELERRRSDFAGEFASTIAGGWMAAFDGNLAEFAAQRLRDALYDRLFDLFNQIGRQIFNNMNGDGGGGFLASVASAAFGGGKAAGGPVRAGYAYRVGERGPETIIPAQNGMVLPNAAMAPMRGQGGGVTVVNQFHLHAEGAVMTDELLREMDAKAETAGRTAVAVSRNDLASIRKRNSRRLG